MSFGRMGCTVLKQTFSLATRPLGGWFNDVDFGSKDFRLDI
jgi:hypothetical protein